MRNRASLYALDADTFSKIYHHLKEPGDRKSIRSTSRGLRAFVDSTITSFTIYVNDSLGHCVSMIKRSYRYPSLQKLKIVLPPVHDFNSNLIISALAATDWDLKEISIENGRFGYFEPSSLANIGMKVQVLALARCDLTGTGLQKLAGASWRYLQELDLSENLMISPHSYPVLLKQCPALKKLSLKNRTIHSAAALSEIMKVKMPCLEEVDFSNNPLGTPGIAVLVRNAGSWPSLKSLILANTGLDSLALTNLCQARYQLEHLNIAQKSVLGFSTASVRHLKSAMEYTWRLKTLETGGSILDADLAHLLTGNFPHLESVNAGRALFATYLVSVYFYAAFQNRIPAFKHLRIDVNRANFEIVKALLSVGWPALKELKLYAGMEFHTGELVHVLQIAAFNAFMPALEVLSLDFEMSGDGAEAMFAYQWPELKHLIMPKASLRDKHANAIASQALENTPKLEKMRVNLSGLSARGLSALFNGRWPRSFVEIKPGSVTGVERKYLKAFNARVGVIWRFCAKTERFYRELW